jgi:hypothetical protein
MYYLGNSSDDGTWEFQIAAFDYLFPYFKWSQHVPRKLYQWLDRSIFQRLNEHIRNWGLLQPVIADSSAMLFSLLKYSLECCFLYSIEVPFVHLAWRPSVACRFMLRYQAQPRQQTWISLNCLAQQLSNSLFSTDYRDSCAHISHQTMGWCWVSFRDLTILFDLRPPVPDVTFINKWFLLDGTSQVSSLRLGQCLRRSP